MRAVFFGTPAIAVPALRALQEIATVTGVVCQPDRPAGRGLALRAPAVKAAALELGLAVHQPTRVRNGELAQWLERQRTDVALVMAYGRILPRDVLDAPAKGCVNLHASLLPKFRGAAPIQWAILRGESETGISLMRMDEGMDTGPVYCQRRLAIGASETAGELAERLALLAAQVTREDLPRALCGELAATPQPDEGASHAPPIERGLADIDWTRTAGDIVRLVRAMAPEPGARSVLRGKNVKLLQAAVSEASGLEPGEVDLSPPATILVGAGRGAVSILRAQLAGRRASDARDLINGRVLRPGDRLGS